MSALVSTVQCFLKCQFTLMCVFPSDWLCSGWTVLWSRRKRRVFTQCIGGQAGVEWACLSAVGCWLPWSAPWSWSPSPRGWPPSSPVDTRASCSRERQHNGVFSMMISEKREDWLDKYHIIQCTHNNTNLIAKRSTICAADSNQPESAHWRLSNQ